MALTPPPSSNIPAWAAGGNNPYSIPALGQFYNVMKQDPGFAMRTFQNLPGMQNLVMSAINGGSLGRNWAANPAMQDYRNLDAYYAGGNGNRPGGFLEGLGANRMNPEANLAAGWTVAPGGMKNMNNINQWAQAVNAAAYGNNQAQYNQLMGNTPTGVSLINFNGSQLGIPGATNSGTPNAPGPTNGQTPAGTNATPGSVGSNVTPYGAGYTGFGNTRISTPASGAVDNTTNPTGAGPQGQAPGTAGSFVAGPTPAPVVSNVNTNASALPPATTNPAGTSGQGSFISTSVPKPQVRTNVFAGGNPNFNEFRPPNMTNLNSVGRQSSSYLNQLHRLS